MGSTVTDRITGLSTSIAIKAPVQAITQGNITLYGLDVQAGGGWAESLIAGNRVLVKDQSNAVENGIYIAHTTGWRRARDFNGYRDAVQGTAVPLASTGDRYRVVTEDPIIIGSSEIEFQLHPNDARVIPVTSRAIMKTYDVPAGYQFDLEEGGRSGRFVVRSGTPPSDPAEGLYVVLANGNYAERSEVAYIDPAWYGADATGSDPSDSEWDYAISHAISMGLAVLPSPGTYKKVAPSAHDNFVGLYVFGRGKVTIDFQTDDAFKFGDFTQDGSGFFTQTTPTVKDIVFSGVHFKPTANGWDGGNFAYARPLYFSAAQNVHVIDDCQFHDNHVGAVDFAAPCKDIYVHGNHFESSEEANSTYGVRPFAYVAPLDNLDETTGTLAYAAPTVYHENVNIHDNTFYQIGRGIVSWNVKGFNYHHNTFRKPLVRTISATNWSRDGSIHHNIHIAEDNTTSTLSTFVNIGVGSEDVVVHSEQFLGELSGTGNNASLKCIDCGGVSTGIEILGNLFKTEGMASAVNVGPNVEITIAQKNKFKASVIGAGNAPIIINESPATTPGFNFPKTIIADNIDYANNRFVLLNGEPPGTPETLEVHANRFKVLLANRLVLANATSGNWDVSAWDNDFPLGAFTYIDNIGSGGIKKRRIDELDKGLISVDTSGASVSLDWRNYGGNKWHLTPDVAQTISDISGENGNGQRLTIIAGGSLTFNNGSQFRLDGGANKTIGENDSISFISRSGIWFETSSAET